MESWNYERFMIALNLMKYLFSYLWMKISYQKAWKIQKIFLFFHAEHGFLSVK